MARRSWITWLLVLYLGLVACGIGVMAQSMVLLGRELPVVINAFFPSPMESAIFGYLLLAVFEIVTAAVIWATRGPILALAWILIQVANWQGR